MTVAEARRQAKLRNLLMEGKLVKQRQRFMFSRSQKAIRSPALMSLKDTKLVQAANKSMTRSFSCSSFCFAYCTGEKEKLLRFCQAPQKDDKVRMYSSLLLVLSKVKACDRVHGSVLYHSYDYQP